MSFSSATAGVNAVSLPTYYVTMVLIDGQPYAVAKNGVLTASDDPSRPVLDGDGLPWTLDAAREEGHTVSETFSDVSWRTPFGANVQHPKDAETFLDGLLEVAPGVNTLRIDFNAATLHNPNALARFQELANAAVDRDLQLIIQYSDGEMSGRATPNETLYPSRTSDPSGRMADIGKEWAEVMAWFEQPENSAILDAVYGWELVNEPMAYPQTEEAGSAYAQDILGVLNNHGTDWHGKFILVGGLGASAQFGRMDLDTLRDAIGDDLIWSMHLYPDWGHDSTISFTADGFAEQIASRIGMLDRDNILLTETHMGRPDTNGNGVDDRFDLDADADGAASFNAARVAEFFADNGIGFTYWPPVARQSALIISEGRDGWSIAPSQTAFGNLAWSSGEDPIAWRGDDSVVATSASDSFQTPFAQGYGYAGNDTVQGLNSTTNMLYGGKENDSVVGGDHGDYVFGGHGNDHLLGRDGYDSILGGSGDDTLMGDAGNDWLEGQSGDDLLEGGDGSDTLIADGGDIVTGGEGADTIVMTATETGTVWMRDYTEGDMFDLRFWEGADLTRSILTLHDSTIAHEDGTTSQGVRIVSSADPDFVLLVEGIDAETLTTHEAFGSIPTEVAATDEDWIYNTDQASWTGGPDNPDDTDGENSDDTDPSDPSDTDGTDPDDNSGDNDNDDNTGSDGGDTTDPSDPNEPTTDPDPTGDGTTDDPETEDPEEEPSDVDDDTDGTDNEPTPETHDHESRIDRTCFVATAAYGDPRHPDVVALRRWRDTVLVHSSAGRAAIAIYWRIGPILARSVGPDRLSGRTARMVLHRIATWANQTYR